LAVDSHTVISWVGNTINARSRVKTKNAAEMLVMRQLDMICDTISEFGLNVSVQFVPTAENKADCMTRVPKRWLGHRETGSPGANVTAALATGESIKNVFWAAHFPHQLGIDRTLYLARLIRGICLESK